MIAAIIYSSYYPNTTLLLGMPKLITKLPEEKDPVICICFEKEWDAIKTNEDLITKYAKDEYQVRFMPTPEKTMNLMLISNDNQKMYKNLSYNYEKFLWWMEYTKKGNSFSFCHVIEEKDKHTVVRTIGSKKLFVLKVKKYTLVNEENFTI